MSLHTAVRRIRFALHCAALPLALLAAKPSVARAQTDVIRGKVTTTEGLPLPGVRVTATSIPGNVTRETRTTNQGTFQIAFPGGPGDYIMGYALIGDNFRQFEIKRLADEDVLIADARLAVVQLDTVVSTASSAQRINRNSTTPDVSGTEITIATNLLPPELQGDIAAMAASLPGVTLIPGLDGAPDGFSVLGLGADQNTTTLNGMSFNSGSLPRDANVTSSLTTSPYDGSRGGFSGAWAVLSDGRVAFIRGRDYRIDYLNADGTWTSSARLPFDWQHLTDDDKQRLVDSVKTVNQKTIMTGYVSSMIRWVNMFNRPYPASFKVPDGYTPTPGLMRDWKLPPDLKLPPNYIYGCPPGVTPTTTPTAVVAGAPAAAAPMGPPGAIMGTPSCIPSPVMVAGGNAPPPPTMREISVFPASDLPDYRPPLPGNSARADMDGNLWLRTIPAKPVPGGVIYDIVSPQGELVDRLQLPPGYTLVGFGRGKVVYLSMRDVNGIHLARVRLK